MADYQTLFSVTFDPGVENLDAALALYTEMSADEYETDERDAVRFACERHENLLWLHDGGRSDTDGVITFVLACAEKFGLKGRWGFEYANWCSKPRLDAYGGGAIMLDLETGYIEGISTNRALYDFLSNRKVHTPYVTPEGMTDAE